ncbi:sulfatase family protein [Algibacter mikhailovii]|uniref:Arylsulfatase n=1 Tax=Algibacter mikhailovii TaxID=425498 RepID=A0A918RAH9_9FLAO|nr:sulfatase-like hydrolase/transferase [Algibacter mikhailovii]GGZ92046.1 arylsulfatase [Algibacter mikhailovii]
MKRILYILLLSTILGCAQEKPNVILIVSDDHGYADFSYKKNFDYIKTPNLDQMKLEGANFTNAYVTAPICSPSRCGIITGQYQERSGNYFYGGPGLDENTPTMAQGFKSAGYSTAYFGKLHYGKNDSPEGFAHPINHGFDESITAGKGGRVHYLYHNKEAIEKHSATAAPWFKNGKEFEKDGFTTEIISAWAQDYIDAHKNKPFFLQVSFNAVHNFNHQLPEKYLKEWNLPYYPDYEELQTDKNYNQWYNRSILPNMPNGRMYYAAQLYYLDREIGNIRSKLKELGMNDNTIVIYISDNGGSNCNGGENKPLRSTKYSLYEGGIRVPMMISWGNKYENIENNMTVSAMDLMPTLLTAAHAPKNSYDQCDGINILPHITNASKVQREPIVWDVDFAWAVRNGDWKLKVVTDKDRADKIAKKQHTDLGNGVELYNLKEDIGESHNLAKQYPEIVEELTIIHNEWKQDVSE